jgi:hypothetical protein
VSVRVVFGSYHHDDKSGSHDAPPLAIIEASRTRARSMLPPGLVGLLVAATLAAAMSSIDSVATAGASLFCLDIYRPFINPQASPRHLVGVGRLVILVMSILTGEIGVHHHKNWLIFPYDSNFLVSPPALIQPTLRVKWSGCPSSPCSRTRSSSTYVNGCG